MSSETILAKLAKAISLPPVSTPFDYEGLQLRWKMFVFRPAEFKTEGFLLLGVLAYLLYWYIGKSSNAKRANAWFEAHLPFYEQQFSKPTTTGLVSDGYTDFFNFSTGRRNVASLHTTFTLLPRHDFLQVLYSLARGAIELDWAPNDEVELDFTLSEPGSAGFVWAVVAKEELSKIRGKRWDMTFTKTIENPQFGTTVNVMTEFADVTEALLKSGNNTPLPIIAAIQDPLLRPYFRSISITDQPRDRPALPTTRQRHVIVSLTLPPASQATVTIPLVKAVFALVDSLDAKSNTIRPETKSKLRKVREDLDESIKREAEAEKREEAEMEKVAAKRKAEQDRLSKLSAPEQKKILEREKKRAMRKTQGKTMRKA